MACRLAQRGQDGRDALWCRAEKLHVQLDGRKDWVEADQPVERQHLRLSADRRPEKCRASAKEYDDQVGDADGDDAAAGGQQQDALKSGHSALLGMLASV